MADALERTGLLAAGYTYINLDDGVRAPGRGRPGGRAPGLG